jgi:hypothetical protein
MQLCASLSPSSSLNLPSCLAKKTSAGSTAGRGRGRAEREEGRKKKNTQKREERD